MPRTEQRRRSSQRKTAKSTRSNGNGRRERNDYVEEPGWGSAFHRPDNESPQPYATGTGVLDRELAKAILEKGGEFQIAVWLKRGKTGTRYFRFHIEPMWDGGEDADDSDLPFEGDDDDAQGAADDDDMPF